ncbi:MAG: hypothetical protein GTN89_07745 [Acidobacteria bacterium]|nr:hypothetical protein [Acidobacteriota bacterium]NIM64225.1 hypothetical protein [Acidobacteriota bacterium]NIO59223.1 hypothetical protein [Acidobacteriota bacterium]NIQ30250.1 hypothetical protein [Acidobacteriota bacterium]NIQ85178.1 hypothetical protein [Acidobacteriota bacterium]
MSTRAAVARLAFALAVVAGLCPACGKKAPPLPPELRGPNAPPSVTVRQIGELPHVVFELPAPRGTKPAQEMARVELIRVVYDSEEAPPPTPDAFRRRGERVRVELGDPFTPGAVLALSDPTVTELERGGVRQTLRYAVRVLDRRGRPSAWVAAPDLVLVAATPPPQGLTAEPTAAGVRLAWSGATDHGYNVYRSTADGVLTLLNDLPIRAEEYLDEDVQIGQPYEYRVRALFADGRPRRETNDSNVASVTAVDRFPPQPPQGLVAVQEGTGVRLFWDPSPERDVTGYRVFRSVDGAGFERIGPDPLTRPLYLDADVRTGQRVIYRVTAVDGASPPNESGPAETPPLALIDEPASGEDGPG